MDRTFIELTEFTFRSANGEYREDGFHLQSLTETPLIETGLVTEAVQSIPEDPELIGTIFPSERLFRIIHLDELSQIRSTEECEAFLDEQFAIPINAYTITVLDDEQGLPYAFAGMKDLDAIAGLFLTKNLAGATTFLKTNHRLPRELHPATYLSLGALVNYLQFEKEPSPVAYLELGENRSILFLLSANKLSECHHLPFGFNQMVTIVQEALDIKYTGSAIKVFLNAVYDMNEFADQLITEISDAVRPILSDFTMRTGQSADYSVVGAFPANQLWIQESFARATETKPLRIDFTSWLGQLRIHCPDELKPVLHSPASLSLIQLIRLKAQADEEGVNSPWSHNFYANGLPETADSGESDFGPEEIPEVPPLDEEPAVTSASDTTFDPTLDGEKETESSGTAPTKAKPSPAIIYGGAGAALLVVILILVLALGGGSTRHLEKLQTWTDGSGWVVENPNPLERKGIAVYNQTREQIILNQIGWLGQDRLHDVVSLESPLAERWALVSQVEIISRENNGGLAGIRLTNAAGSGPAAGVFLTTDGSQWRLLHRSNRDSSVEEVARGRIAEGDSIWLRMERRREEISSFISFDGEEWESLPGLTLTGNNLRGGPGLHVPERYHEGVAVFSSLRFGSF